MATHTHSEPAVGRQPRARRRAEALAVAAAVAIVVLAAFLRVEGLGRDSLWSDESASVQYARWPISHRQHWQNGMALFHSILHVWVRVAGENEAALRFPSAVFGVAAVALLIGLVRRVSGWPAALLAGLILALSWKHVYYSQEARSYSLFIMLSVLTTLLLVRLLERPGTGRLVAYGVALLALAYSHYQWIFVVVFHNLAVLLSRRRVGWGWLVLHAALAAAYVPQILLGVLPMLTTWRPVYITARPTLFVAIWTLQNFSGVPPHLPIAGHLPGAVGINLLQLHLMPVLAAAGIVAYAQVSVLRLGPRLRRALPTLSRYAAPLRVGEPGRRWGWLPLVWLGSVFVLPFVIAQTGKPLFEPRYAAGTLPVYCWLIGAAIAALPRVGLRPALAAVCVLGAVPSLETMKAFPMRQDWRGYAETITQDEQPGDRIVICHTVARRSLCIYYRGSLPITAVSRDRTTDADIAEGLTWTQEPKRVWLVVSHDPTPAIIRYLMRRPDFRLVRRWPTIEYGSFDRPPPILLMLFERVPPDDVD